jgi:hypothetical protein
LVSKIEVFMAVKIQVKYFPVMTPCGVVVGYQCSIGSWCLKMEAAWAMTLHGITTQKKLT